MIMAMCFLSNFPWSYFMHVKSERLKADEVLLNKISFISFRSFIYKVI